MSQGEKGQIIIYQTEDGRNRIECHLIDEAIWLSQGQIGELFDRSKKTISEHLQNIFLEEELEKHSVVRNFRTTASDGKIYDVVHYNLEAILSVGFRVKSLRGTQFRRWANTLLKELITKGFVMDDERLKNPESSVYFDQLLERIRDIRSSEKVFWRKVCDIYATSIDYDGKAETSQAFFAGIQNKMHWAAHGHTAAEIIHQRADSSKSHMGLSNIAGKEPRKSEISIAKNYLKEDELNILNRIVTAYLEFAELQAERGRLMKMVDWVTKLDDFLKLGDHDLLTHAGNISAEQAKEKAELEYDRYRRVIDVQPTQVDRDLEVVIGKLLKKGDENDGR
ncbi:MAG: virulence RhuM family protein [Candidatus Thiodiazotropha sp. (ex Rostrolucina anterorostrata)]|nr:virulence RhuM family protein [Candidatus Thiodiazotropha sp. (ex Rostrolucina anterorostrata)]